MNQISTNYYKLKYLKYKIKYKLYKQNMFASIKKEKNTQLYSFNGVHAYLNDDKDKCKLDELNYNNGYFTGIKWQCVEYARRYIQSVFGVTFSQVESAYEIPNSIFTRLEDNKIIKPSIYNISNKLESLNHSLDSLSNSLIIWPKDYEPESPHGHVAIIVSANKDGESNGQRCKESLNLSDGLYVAEQNYDNNNYYRFIPLNNIKNVTIISINN